jgi:predicted  nucleic acid-binding Zn-ribbon protein
VTHPLEAIVALQKKDLRLIRLLREVQDIPKRKDDIEQQVNGFKRKLEETSEQRKKLN